MPAYGGRFSSNDRIVGHVWEDIGENYLMSRPNTYEASRRKDYGGRYSGATVNRQMRPGRVCIIAKYLYPIDTRLRQQARTLEQAGIEVDILCLRGKSESRLARFGGVTAHRVADERPKGGFVNYLRLTLWFAAAAFLKLQLLCLRKDYNVVVVHTLPEFLVFIGIAQKISGKPLILDARDLSLEVFESKWGRSEISFLKPLVKCAKKASCAFADRIITASPGFRERLIRNGVRSETLTVVINSADPEIFRYQTDRHFKRITRGARLLYHGTVAPRFGLTEAVEAVHLLQDRIPGTELHIYGKCDPSHRAELEKKIGALNLKDRVFLYEPRILEEIYEIIKSADIGVVPYRSDDCMNLALSTKMFEYTAAGLPVAASRLRSAEAIFDDESIRYAEPGSPADLAEKIAELCLDPKGRRLQAEHAKNAHSKVSAKIMSKRYLSLVQELM
jgi:glycosyltransferase involved in cell wall biosynthesis